MGIQNFQRSPDINAGLKEFSATPRAVLLDVRTPEEYQNGHIPQSINIPLQSLDSISIDKDVPLFIYCYSGARSESAVRFLKQHGYTRVQNIGGMHTYLGKAVK